MTVRVARKGEFARLVAQRIVAETMDCKIDEIQDLDMTAHSVYNVMARSIPTFNWQDAMEETWGEGSYRFFIHNINYLKTDMRQVCLRLAFQSWGLQNKKAKYIEGIANECRLCGEKKETYRHLFKECAGVNELKKGWQEGSEKCGKKEIGFEENGWGMAES